MIQVKSVKITPPPRRPTGAETAQAPVIELPAGKGLVSEEESRVAKKRLVVGKIPRAAETVIGDENRERIYDTNLPPWRMICSLKIYSDAASGIGTGWLVGPKTIITAGHCVYDERTMFGPASRIEVRAGRDDDDEPFHTVTSTRFETTDLWRQQADVDFDIGCIQLDTPLGDQTGWFGIKSLSARELQGYRVNIAGYPLDAGNGRLGQGRCLYHHQNVVRGVSDRRIFYAVDTTGGQSGAPVWIYETADGPPLVVGVHAYGTDATPTSMGIEANSAPRIIPEVAELIRRWVAEA